mmetsp:Transcript_27423/g.52224  ORF Transcript_27423/g.52224 Transcript_27423/m.52224 type:complete len:202 (+) Transcript_27423:1063-1668(+)
MPSIGFMLGSVLTPADPLMPRAFFLFVSGTNAVGCGFPCLPLFKLSMPNLAPPSFIFKSLFKGLFADGSGPSLALFNGHSLLVRMCPLPPHPPHTRLEVGAWEGGGARAERSRFALVAAWAACIASTCARFCGVMAASLHRFRRSFSCSRRRMRRSSASLASSTALMMRTLPLPFCGSVLTSPSAAANAATGLVPASLVLR